MTVWLKILLILILGGILSTLGDRLGSKVGKARLSIFKLRPKSTAVLITVFTGSIISAISFATMVVFDRDLRVGLFQLEDIREKIIASEKELKKLEKNLYAFRSGNVVISSGQTLVTKTIKLNKNSDIRAWRSLFKIIILGQLLRLSLSLPCNQFAWQYRIMFSSAT